MKNGKHSVMVALPPELKAFVDEQIVQGDYSNPGEYFAELVSQARRRKAEEQLIKLVQEAEASGPAKLMTKKDWQAIRARAIKQVTKAKPRNAPRSQKTRSRR